MFNFVSEDAARETIEKIRWPSGVRCAHCDHDKVYKLTPKPQSNRPVRKGVYKCAKCRKQFTCTVGTIFSDSHIPLQKWLFAIHLLCSSKKGMSAHQLHRMLGINYRSAWFMAHRIRHAMRPSPADIKIKLTGVVEADETYIGGHASRKKGTGFQNKTGIVALVQRGGQSRGFVIAKKNWRFKNLKRTLLENIDPSAHLMTDEFKMYKNIGKQFASHETVKHGIGEYVRGEAHINTAEGFFSTLKRGIHGTYHHVGKAYLPRYLDEFNFRYNTRTISDYARTTEAIRETEGKRLVYRLLK